MIEVIQSLTTGLNPRKNFVLNSPGYSLPYVTGKDVYGNVINISERTDKIDKVTVDLINKRARIQDDILLFASTGTGTVGRMAYVKEYDGNWNVSETLFVIKSDTKVILTKFLMYSLYANNAIDQYSPKISKGSVPHLKIKDLLNVRIPIPPLAEQERIVGILDRFESLTTSLAAGLPAEIAARRRQYEHYRDRLLTFRRKVARGEK